MNRIDQLLKKLVNRPQSYEYLRQNPFPYLQDCNRLEIFEFIYQLEAQNASYKAQIANKYPDKTIQQCFQNHRMLQAKKKLMQITQESTLQMDLEIKEKIQQIERIRIKNADLAEETKQLSKISSDLQVELIEAQKEKRFLEMKIRLQQERQAHNVGLSTILNNLYGELKATLNEPL